MSMNYMVRAGSIVSQAAYNPRKLATPYSLSLKNLSRAEQIQDKITLSEAAIKSMSQIIPGMTIESTASNEPNVIESLEKQLKAYKRSNNL